MTFTELRLAGFKPFGDLQTLRLAPLTLVYGPNSSGKSSIIQSLLLTKQSLEGSPRLAELVPRGDFTDLGSFAALVHRHRVAKPFTVGFSYTGARIAAPAMSPYPKSGRAQPSKVHIDLTYGLERGKGRKAVHPAELQRVRYELHGASEHAFRVRLVRRKREASSDAEHESIATFTPADQTSYDELAKAAFERLERVIRPGRQQSLFGDSSADDDEEEFLYPEDQKRALDATIQAGLSKLGFNVEGGLPSRATLADEGVLGGMGRRASSNVPKLDASMSRVVWDELSGSLSQSLGGICQATRERLRLMTYLGPLRSSPQRYYDMNGAEVFHVGTQGEHTPQVLQMRGRQLKDNVNQWFKRFDIPYTLAMRTVGDKVIGALVSMTLRDLRTKVEVSPSDVGFGIGQLLPVMVQGLLSRAELICVEQPEIHLHPRLQAELAEFFIETSGIRKGEGEVTGKQWLIETHSEALIRRLQRRIREGVVNREDVSVLYVEPGSRGSRVLELRIDDDGSFIDPWPGGFFDERFDDIFGGAP